MNISAPFIQRPIATALLMVGLLVGGLVTYRLLPVAALPSSQRGGVLSTLFQTASQDSAPPSQPAPAPIPLAPAPSGGSYRPPPTRTSAPPPNPSARPEAGAGLDGWLVDRLFRR